MRLHLTDIAVRSLKPQDGKQLKVWDTTTPGFGVLVNERSKSWMVTYGPNRKTKILGRYPEIALSAARAAAKKAMLAPDEPPPTLSLSEAVTQFLTSCEQRLRPRTVADYRRLLNRHLIPTLGRRSLESIKTHDILQIVDALKSTPSEQNHVHTAATILFTWCLRRNHLTVNPIGRLQLPARLKTREKTLSPAELKKVWLAAEGTVLGKITRLCILSGQRRSEIGSLQWEWINQIDRTITFPSHVTKNGREHLIPYGPMSEAIFETVPRISEFLFPGRDDNPTWQGWSKAKRELDKKSGVDGYRIHDLRRTWASFNAEWSQPHVLERMLNHVTGVVSGVAAIYNRYSYLDEMRLAVEKWETRLSQILAA